MRPKIVVPDRQRWLCILQYFLSTWGTKSGIFGQNFKCSIITQNLLEFWLQLIETKLQIVEKRIPIWTPCTPILTVTTCVLSPDSPRIATTWEQQQLVGWIKIPIVNLPLTCDKFLSSYDNVNFIYNHYEDPIYVSVQFLHPRRCCDRWF